MRRHSAVEGAAVVVRREIIIVIRGILDQHGGQQFAGVQHGRVEQRLEGGAAGACRRNHVHVGAAQAGGAAARIAVIGPDLARVHVHHQDAHVVHEVGVVAVEIALRDGVHPRLQGSVQGHGIGPVARFRAAALQQVVGRVGHRQRLVRQGLVLRQHAFRGIDVSFRLQLVQQSVALLEQALPGAAGMDQARGVGQHGEHRALAPGQVVRAASEIAPGCRFQADHISPEGGVGGIQEQDFPFRTTHLQARGQDHFVDLLRQGARCARAAQADHLHRQGAGAADHLPAGEVLHQGTAGRQIIHTQMPPEAFVFVGHDATGELLGHVVGRREAPLSVRGNTGSQQGSVCRDGRRAEGLFEQMHG